MNFVLTVNKSLRHISNAILISLVSTSFGAILCVALLRSECGSTPLANHSFINHFVRFISPKVSEYVRLRPNTSGSVQHIYHLGDVSGAEWSRLVDFGYKMDKNGQETPFKRLSKLKEKHP